MMRGMLAAVSGLKAHETMLDVVANDIANVNTIGFKGSRTRFSDAFSQTLRGAAAATPGSLGGTNATQIGLGVQLGGVESLMTEGSIQSTNVPLDCAIQGNGFFRVATYNAGAGTLGAGRQYTRDGDFTTDSAGNLVTRDGYYVVGFKLDPTTGQPTTTPPTDGVINIPTTASSASIGSDGKVIAIINGVQTYEGQISLATFANSNGLMRTSGNLYTSSANSGAESAGAPADTANGYGSLVPGSLEMSNVDLASEFTSMITAERGFQANSRAITTADEMLQDLVNLKR
jgi:flagellar hook protein FlgE